MIIGGMDPCSLCDYPGRVASVIFTQGCNFRCPFCHNTALLPMNPAHEALDNEAVLGWLQGRRDRIRAVVISGGEPTLQAGLQAFLRRLHHIDLAIKLDTNGSRPVILAELIQAGLTDYVAMDIKAPCAKYRNLAGVRVSTERIKESIRIIAESGLRHEFRTTVVPGLLNQEDISAIRKMVPSGSIYRLQEYRPVLKPSPIGHSTSRLAG